MINKLTNFELSKKIMERLNETEKSEWLRIANTFNSWEFPISFYDLIPKWWGKPGMNQAAEVITPIIDRVKREFGEKEMLRFHNVTKGRMSDSEFEYWFDNLSTSGVDKEYAKYYNRKCFIQSLNWWEDEVFEKLQRLIKTEK